jgi:hypothetical protein
VIKYMSAAWNRLVYNVNELIGCAGSEPDRMRGEMSCVVLWESANSNDLGNARAMRHVEACCT